MTRARAILLTSCAIWSLIYVVSCLIRTEDQDALIIVQALALIGAVWSMRGVD